MVPPRLLLNMLIGVMCEVVSGVSQTERESMAETFVREKVGWVFFVYRGVNQEKSWENHGILLQGGAPQIINGF